MIKSESQDIRSFLRFSLIFSVSSRISQFSPSGSVRRRWNAEGSAAWHRKSNCASRRRSEASHPDTNPDKFERVKMQTFSESNHSTWEKSVASAQTLRLPSISSAREAKSNAMNHSRSFTSLMKDIKANKIITWSQWSQWSQDVSACVTQGCSSLILQLRDWTHLVEVRCTAVFPQSDSGVKRSN